MISKIIREDIQEVYGEFKENLKGLEGKTFLITGGNGLIASYLVDLLIHTNTFLENKIKIKIINKRPVGEKSRLSHLMEDTNVEFIATDVGKDFEIPWKVDFIVHAASRANPQSFLEDPLDTIDSNVNGLRTLLEYARKNKVESFLFFSSGEIYGNPVKEFVPTPESYPGNVDCTHPMACYLEAKRLCETISMIYFRKYAVPVKNLRILLSYGPGMRNDGKVVSDFYVASKEKKEIGMWDRGESKRSFCYISDTLRGILQVMFKGDSGEAYNVGSDLENLQIKELAVKVSELMNNGTIVKPNLDAPEKKIYGVPTRNLDLTKLRSLGFIPKINLEAGLKRLKSHVEEAGWGN
jgi:UDP-glucuronate decarboxylase